MSIVQLQEQDGVEGRSASFRLAVEYRTPALQLVDRFDMQDWRFDFSLLKGLLSLEVGETSSILLPLGEGCAQHGLRIYRVPDQLKVQNSS